MNGHGTGAINEFIGATGQFGGGSDSIQRQKPNVSNIETKMSSGIHNGPMLIKSVTKQNGGHQYFSNNLNHK